MKKNVHRRVATALVTLCATAFGVVSAAPGDRIGTEFRVNTHLPLFQFRPDIAMDARGSAVVVWDSESQDGSGYGVYGRRLSADGTPLGDEFQVNETTLNSQYFAAVAMSADGTFVVAWANVVATGISDIRARRYAADGVAASGEFVVNTTLGDRRAPDVAIDAAGNFVVTWESVSQDGSGSGVYARRYDATGAALGDEFRVNTYTLGNQASPAIAMDQGGFVVAWHSSGQEPGDPTGSEVYVQGYDADGTPRGVELRVNTVVSGGQQNAAIAMDAAGNFVVAWDGAVPGESRGIAARRFDALGTPLGNEFKVNDTPSTWLVEQTPDVAMAENGAFVVGWWARDDFSYAHEFALRRYRADGTPAASQSRLGTGPAYGLQLAADADGDFVTARGMADADVGAQRFQGPEAVDLAVTVDDSSDPVHWNGLFAYYVHVTNSHGGGPAGTGTATGIRAEITLSPGTTLSGYYGGPWTCAGEGTLTCAYGDVLDPGAVATLTLLVNAPGQSGSMSVGAAVSGQQYDSLAANNSDAESTTVGDIEPEPFAFTDLIGVERAMLQVSNPVTVSGIELPVEIWVYGGEYSLNGGEFTALDGTVVAGDEVRVRHVSSAEWGAFVSTSVQIGTTFESFDTQTVARDVVPDPFAFTDQANVARGAVITSDAIVVTGINDAAPITISNGSYSIDGGPFVSTDGTVSAGQSVRVRHTSSAYFSSETDTTLNIGGFQGTYDVFTSTTVAADTTPDPFSFADQVDVARNVVVTSNAIIVSGIDAPASISVVGGQYRIDDGPATSAAGTVSNGQSVRVLHTSSMEFSMTRSTTLTIGTAADTFSSTTLAQDTTPDAFSFAAQSDVERSTVVTSNAIVVSGINDAAPISVTDGAYSIDGAPYTSVAGSVQAGQTVTVQHTSAPTFSTATQTVLTIGGGSAAFTSTTVAQDTTPDAFSFGALTDVARSTAVTSNAIVVTGINDAAAISVAGGTYSIDGGPFTTGAGLVNAGQSVTVQHTSAATFSTQVQTTLTVGGVSAAFTSTTLAQDLTPDPFQFGGVALVPRNTLVTSGPVTVTGINDAAPISVSNGAYSIDGGPFTTSAGTVAAGQSVRVQHTSSAEFSTLTDTVLTIGGVSDMFSSETEPRDAVPDAFSFADASDVATGTTQVSNAVTISGINDATAVSVSGGEYSVNGGAFMTAGGTVGAGDQVRVRHTSAGSASTAVHTTLTVGGVSDTFTSTTGPADTTPDGFSFTDVTGVRRSSRTTSNTITVGGITAPVSITVSGGDAQYSKNGGAYTSAPGTVSAGNTIRVRVTSASTTLATVNVTVTIGGVTDVWSVTTGTN